MSSNTRKPWTPEQIAILRDMYPRCLTVDVAKATGRSVDACYDRARDMGFGKTEDFYQRYPRGRATPKISPGQIPNLFKKGMTPWNKGMKGLNIGVTRTQFKPGQTPRSWLPLGSYRVLQGDLQIKWREYPGSSSKRWKPVSRLVWEACRGPVPAGSIVIFKPGTRSTEVEHIRIENLECVTRKESAMRNHPRTKSPELGRLYSIKGAIARQVNRIARQQPTPSPESQTTP